MANQVGLQISPQLFKKLKARDKEAFGLFYSQTVDIFYRFIFSNYSFLKKIEAEDILSDFYLKIWKNIDTVQTLASFKSWLFTVLNNTIKDYLKKKKEINFSALAKQDEEGNLDFDVEDKQRSVLDVLNEDFAKQDIQKALSKLPEVYQTAVFLRYVEGLTYAQIAQALGISQEAARQRVSRGLKLLKRWLGENS